MKKTLEQRVKYLEGLFRGETVVEGKVTWEKQAASPKWKRSEADTAKGAFVESNVTIEYDYRGHLAAWMNRGITLYAEYIPIYKDVIKKLEEVSKEYGMEVKPIKNGRE